MDPDNRLLGELEINRLPFEDLRRTRSLSDYAAYSSTNRFRGNFALILPSFSDLRLFSRTACALQDKGFMLRTFFYENSAGYPSARERNSSNCRLVYDVLSDEESKTTDSARSITEWLMTLEHRPDIILTVDDPTALGISAIIKRLFSHNLVAIRIPRTDLVYCEWTSSLTLQEWQSKVYSSA